MLLDTTVLIDALRRRPRTIARLRASTGSLLASAVSVDEVLVGVLPGEEELTDLLIDGLEIVPVGLPEARLASAWRREFQRRGVTLEQPDCLIAACAATRGVRLATANVRDFPMPGVQVEHWLSE